MAKLLLADVLKRKGMSKRLFAKKIGKQYYAVFRYFRPGYADLRFHSGMIFVIMSLCVI